MATILANILNLIRVNFSWNLHFLQPKNGDEFGWASR